MTFSVRVALMTAIAVAIAAIGASVLMYFVLQTQLLSQFDNTLVEAASGVREQSTGNRGGPGRFPGGPTGGLSGRSDVAAQLINSTTGQVGRSDAQPVVALVTADAVEVASGTKPAYFFETTIEGSHLFPLERPLETAAEVQRWIETFTVLPTEG